MLSHALRTRTRQHASIFRLHSHQHYNHTLTSTSEEHEEHTVTPTPVLSDKFLRRTAFIQTWEPFHNLTDAWALLRALELKYGKIVEAQFIKDYEMTNKYQMYTYVCFLDSKSIKKIPSSGYTFHITAPVEEDRPGGIGLDDIKHLLESTDVDESFEFDPVSSAGTKFGERVIGARITRSPRDIFTVPKYHPVPPNSGLARAFLRWRGFHKLEPLAISGDIGEDEWFSKPVWEKMRMRSALQRCSKMTGLPNPAVAVARKTKTHENDGKVSDSSPASTSKDSPESSSPTAHKNDGKVSNSSPASTSPESSSPTTHENDGKVSNSSPASMGSPESGSPTMHDIPISHESTSKLTQSHSSKTESPQPPSQSPPEPTQLSPDPTPPNPTILSPGQLTPEQKKTMERQMARAKQLMAKTKQSASKKARKSKKEPEEKPKDQMLDKSPEEPLDTASKGVVASFWKMLGR